MITARLGHMTLLIESEPNAETFYLRHGVELIGSRVSPVDPARMLPLLRRAVGPVRRLRPR